MIKKEEFWDNIYKKSNEQYKINNKYLEINNRKLVELLGEIKGKKVLDIGCGNGFLSLYLAKKGAKVTSIDNSSFAIKNIKRLAELNKVFIKAKKMNVLDLNKMNQHFDLIVGKFILHHIEPFEKFPKILFKILRKNGKGVFIENNSRNKILIFFRKYIVGKFGIPKYGDDQEYPFGSRKIKYLKNTFDHTKIYYPKFVFFIKMNTYILRWNKKFKYITKIFSLLDNLIHKHCPILNKYSYEQIIEIKK